MPTQPKQLDPQLVDFAKSLRDVESGGDFKAKGKSGEYGAYQWIPETWAAKSKESGVNVPLEQSTPQQQNEVAYKTLEKWRQQHPEWNLGNFASAWNAGENAPDAYLGHSGTNSHGVKYDTAVYAKKVAERYHTYKAQSTGQGTISGISTNSPLAEGVKDVGNELSGRFNQGGKAISDASSGKISPLSGVLQTVGAAAGAAGDLVNRGLELIPGVKQVEDILGKGIGMAAETGIGKSVIEGYQAWAQEHPEAAGNVGAIVNIASVFPLFKAFSLAKNVTKSAVAKAFETTVAKSATKELEGALSLQAGRKLVASAERKGVKPAEELVKRNYVPEIEKDAMGNDIYSFKNADELANVQESNLEQQLQAALASKFDKPIALTQARNNAIKEARDSIPFGGSLPAVEKKIHDTFDFWEGRYGKDASLAKLTEMKRGVREDVKFDSPTLDKDSSYYVGQGLMKSVEDTANSRGIKGINGINKEMGKIIQLRKVMTHLDGKKFRSKKKGGLLREVGADVVGGVGETAGTAMGFPIIGALGARAIGGGLLNRGAKSSFEKLSRARKPLLPDTKRALKLAAPLVVQQSATKKTQ